MLSKLFRYSWECLAGYLQLQFNHRHSGLIKYNYSNNYFYSNKVISWLFGTYGGGTKLLKEKLRDWLLQKVAEGGKGPSVLDEGGQGVLHFAAALGYDWALEPTTIAGVSVNFRDINGWTALHWAAFSGRWEPQHVLCCLFRELCFWLYPFVPWNFQPTGYFITLYKHVWYCLPQF